MRIVIMNCSDRSDHALHVSNPRRSTQACVESIERVICPGGRVGDRRLRHEETADIVHEWDEEHRCSVVDGVMRHLDPHEERHPHGVRVFTCGACNIRLVD